MKLLRAVVMALGVFVLCAAAAPAAVIVDSIDGTGVFTFSGDTSSPSDLSDWFTFYADAGTPVVLQTLPPQFFDTYLNLYRTPAGPAKAGDLVSTFVLTAFDDDNGVGNLSTISVTLALGGYYAVEVRGFGNAAGRYAYSTAGNVQAVPDTSAPVPEPASLAMMGAGLAIAARRLRRSPGRSHKMPPRGRGDGPSPAMAGGRRRGV